MCKQKGFSLIELLIVVAIILIIVAIAIPNLMRSRMAANEASAVGALRSVNICESIYATTYPGAGYATSLNALSDGGTPANCPASPSSVGACLIDATLATAVDNTHLKSGYFFTMLPIAALGYTVHGAPSNSGLSGIHFFYTDSTGVIRSDTVAASATSPAI